MSIFAQPPPPEATIVHHWTIEDAAAWGRFVQARAEELRVVVRALLVIAAVGGGAVAALGFIEREANPWLAVVSGLAACTFLLLILPIHLFWNPAPRHTRTLAAPAHIAWTEQGVFFLGRWQLQWHGDMPLAQFTWRAQAGLLHVRLHPSAAAGRRTGALIPMTAEAYTALEPWLLAHTSERAG